MVTAMMRASIEMTRSIESSFLGDETVTVSRKRRPVGIVISSEPLVAKARFAC
jgi:hypothetical protein